VARGSLSPWVVVRVEAMTPAEEPDYATVREELRDYIAADEAADMLNEAIRGFEDARAGGASLAEAARQHNLPVVTIAAVEAGGRDQEGREVEALAGHDEVLSTAFQTREGEASDFIPAGDADVTVGVDRIIAASVRPLAEVRGELVQAWIARERAQRMRELGEQVVAAVQGGQSLAQAARAHRMSVVVSSRPITRRDAQQIPARGLAGQIFGASVGTVVSDTAPNGSAVLVAVVEQINRPDPAEAPQQVEAARAAMEQSVTQSLAEAVQADILDQARPRRNEQLLNTLFRSAANAEDSQ
jgi:peptidyl-prolyl cis-trans isomerase D